MRKKITAIILAASAAVALCACSSPENEERTKYTIDAMLSEDNTLTATVVCDYVNNTDVPLGELWFHMYPNAYREGSQYRPVPDARISEAYPSGMSYSVVNVTGVSVNGSSSEVVMGGTDENVLTVALGKTLEPTERVTVSIEYNVKLPKIKHRFGYTDKSVNLGNFYPVACVYKDGAFVADPYYSTGDPFFSECADYNVKFTVPSKYEGAFTGSVRSKTENENTVTYDVSAENVRDFAAVFGEYEKISGRAGSTVVNYLYYNDGDAESALNTAIDAVNVFGEMFGEYPYGEYTVVQTGFMNGGMEYPCLSMISDAYGGDSKRDIIVHETAHQWWYGVVGNDEVKHSWMDEGLAEYSAMMFYERAEGYNYTFNEKRADALSAYMLYCETYKNNGLGDTSMTRAVNEYGNETEYSYMIYVKGALMFDDIRNTVGTNAFNAGLKRYFTENKFKTAEPQNLIGAIEKASNRQISPLVESWLNGSVKLYSSH